MSAIAPPRPVYLGEPGRQIFGLFHETATGGPPTTAVLICPPFGWEEVCSYRSRREWAAELASSGHPALRIDLPGSGDSAGSSSDPALVEAWVESLSDAAGWLRAISGCERVAAIGIGLGGLLATRAAAAGAPIDDLVLWSVPARGRTLIRELRAFALLNAKEVAREDIAGPPPPDGQIETGGFLLIADTIARLREIDLAALSLPGAEDRRILILERDGIDADEGLVDHLKATGASVSVARGEGYGSMMAHPQEARPPRRTFATVASWLREAPPGTGRPVEAGDHPESPAATISVEGARVRETPLSIEMPFGRIFGVLTEPMETPAADLCAVLLNAGALRRIGPGRMWVELARRWAARGVPSLRLDIEGIGDADGDATRYEDVKALYEPEFVGQVLAALDELDGRLGPRRYLLCGLCSGAYWAFHGALRDDRVKSAFLINPRVLYWDDALLAIREVRKTQRLLDASSWQRILRGDIGLSRVLELLRWGLIALARTPGQILSRRHRRHQLDEALDQLRETGKRTLFVFGQREPLRDELKRDGRLGDGGARWPNLEVEFVAGRHHALEPVTAQARVHELLARALEAELTKAGASTPGEGPPGGGEARTLNGSGSGTPGHATRSGRSTSSPSSQ